MSIDQNFGSQSYFKIVETLRDALLSHSLCNTVTVGDISDIDMDKQTIFPLAHINVGNANFSNSIITYDISVLIMDLVHDDLGTTETSTSEAEPSIYQNSTELYVFNSMLNIGNHLTDKLFNGDLYDGNTFVERSSVVAEPFRDRFQNVLCGWSFNFKLTTRNNIDRCNS